MYLTYTHLLSLICLYISTVINNNQYDYYFYYDYNSFLFLASLYPHSYVHYIHVYLTTYHTLHKLTHYIAVLLVLLAVSPLIYLLSPLAEPTPVVVVVVGITLL